MPQLSIEMYIAISALVLIIVLFVFFVLLERRLKGFMKGKNAASLESNLTQLQKDITSLEQFRKEMETYLQHIENRMRTSLRGTGTVNFNAFNGLDSGGSSFATAFLNEKGDGIILSTLRSREQVTIFAKEIKNFSSTQQLSEEEQTALTKAKESCKV